MSLSYSSHDKEKEQYLLLCVVLNFGLVANSFVIHVFCI